MTSKLLSQILDLPSAERIRLAQDIWDSVTEIPDQSILTDWQKEELKKRLDALDEDSTLGIPWKEVLSELRNPQVSFVLVIEPSAKLDLKAAFEWYEEQLDGLGNEFLSSVEGEIKYLEINPEAYQFILGEVRRAPIKKFPVGLFL